jgi:hypothetical protein
MRRFCSITAILTLLYQFASPLQAACPHVQHAPACHRVHEAQLAHHCDPMMHHDQAEPQPSGSDSATVQNSASENNCPMNCCTARHITNAAAIPAGSSLPPLAATDKSFRFLSAVFLTAGFSSHTDRGPPTA